MSCHGMSISFNVLCYLLNMQRARGRGVYKLSWTPRPVIRTPVHHDCARSFAHGLLPTSAYYWSIWKTWRKEYVTSLIQSGPKPSVSFTHIYDAPLQAFQTQPDASRGEHGARARGHHQKHHIKE